MRILNYDEFQAINEAKYTENRSHSLFAMKCLSLRDQVHVWHWQTEIEAKHEALGEFYDELLEMTDDIVEMMMGKYGRISVKSIGTPAPLKDLEGSDINEFVKEHANLFNEFKINLFSYDADIQNKID